MRLIGLSALLLASLFGGCVAHTQNGTMAAGNTAFLVRNQSAIAVCYVNISPSADGNWGPDRLGPSEVISPGQERGWEFPAGYYDFRLQDCQRNVVMERRQLPFPSDDGLILTFRAPE